MSPRRRRTGRVKIAFEYIEAIAAAELADDALATAMGERFTLTRHSALHRCRDGRYTLCLVWKGSGGSTLTRTIRGIEVEGA